MLGGLRIHMLFSVLEQKERKLEPLVFKSLLGSGQMRETVGSGLCTMGLIKSKAEYFLEA